MAALTVGSLFSGIGGIELGLERAGMEVRWQVEQDEYCRKVLEKHWPQVKRYHDVRDMQGSSLEAVDLICGGFPCQPISYAGARKGQGDGRWLWPEMSRLVDEIRPSFVLVENVPGLRTLGGTEVILDLASQGYDVEWDSVSAAAIGAPHKRERIFILGYANYYGEPALSLDDEAQRMQRTCSHWRNEPRMDDGFSRKMVKALGNAVVPQVAEIIGRRIVSIWQTNQNY